MRGALAGLILIACSQKLTPIDTSNPPSDGDADTDADADSDTDADSDADTDTGPQLDCQTSYGTPPPAGAGGAYPACVTERVFCGDVIFATTEGGRNDYDYDFWLANAELGSLINNPEYVDGPERVFVFDPLFAGETVTFTVESCNPTWASWVAVGSQTPLCDTTDNNAPKDHFETVQGRYLQETFVLNSSIGTYQVQAIVDSGANSPQPNNFILTVSCD